jgi:Flp pilus assembly CpaF family ATPase
MGAPTGKAGRRPYVDSFASPSVDAMLPDGSRLHVVIPQITREHMAVNIRMFITVYWVGPWGDDAGALS